MRPLLRPIYIAGGKFKGQDVGEAQVRLVVNY